MLTGRTIVTAAALAAALVAACSKSPAPKTDPGPAPPPPPSASAPAPDAAAVAPPVTDVTDTQGTDMATPQLKTAADITKHDGKTVRAVGTYTVEDLGRYRVAMTMPDGTVFKTNKAVYLKLDDGTDLRVGARPDAERAELTDQRVEIEAKVLSKPPPPDDPRQAQMSPMPTLVDIKAVRPKK